jgi:multidrug efflux system outer membrane protein
MRLRLVPLFALALLLTGCNMAPEYHPPDLEVPTRFKESGNWREARPSDGLPRGAWWKSFGDSKLDELERQVDVENQDFAAAVAALDRARAYVEKAQAGLLPTLDLNTSYSANKESAHRPTRKANTVFSATGYAQALIDNRPFNEPDHFGNNMLQLQSTYEVDLWGRVRNTIELGEATAESRAAEVESVKLSLQAELARDYIALRGLDAEAKLFADTIDAYKKALELTRTLEKGDIGAPGDSARAEAQLEVARAQHVDILARRANLEHAIATLVGRPASSFAISPASNLGVAPTPPAGAPSLLLERRPDVAAAERQVAAANAGIGVARAAFFPRLLINLSGGTQDTGLSLFNMRYSFWSLGPSVTLPIFDGGARRADLSAAESIYFETVARYRGVVLRAIQEVEDSLSTIRWLGKELRSREAAAAASQKVLDVSFALYRDGATTYLDVVTAQTALLDSRRAALSIKTRRLQAAVALMIALGGGWSAEFAAADSE